MKKILFPVLTLSCLLFMASCSLIDPPEKKPAYIRINSIGFSTNVLTEGPATSAITDAWVYVDDQLVGVFELPATFPVLADGNHKITIRGGIKLYGMAGYRTFYPFYAPYTEELSLTPGEISEIHPTMQYMQGTTFPMMETFETAGSLFSNGSLSDTSVVVVQATDTLINQNKYGVAYLDAGHTYFEIYNSTLYSLPTTGEPVFVEVDFRSTIKFTLGILISYPTSVVNKDLVTFFEDENWKKMYINLTTTLTEATTADGFKLYIKATKPVDMSTATICFDNIKIVH